MSTPASDADDRSVHSPDLILLASTTALLVVGTLMVYSASFVVAHNEFNDDTYFLVRHVINIAAGAAAAFVLMRIDYRTWQKLSLPIMVACLILLVLVLIPGIGARNYGAVRWIKLGSITQIQPSELAKVAIVIYLAAWLARRGPSVKYFGRGSLPFVIIVGLVAGLVELQPDLGTTSIIVGTAAAVFFVAGANLLHVGALGVSVFGAAAFMLSRMQGYRSDRIRAFLDPWSDLQDTGWHTAQTLIALGSGGFAGMGLGGSHQKFYWVPNAHTDAIYAIIGEELGFIGTFGVLVLFVIFAWRGFAIAWHAPDAFGRLVATGLTASIVLQALINIAVVTNSIPYTGITLPLVSFGGSSIAVTLAAVGILLNISRYRGRPVEAANDREPVPEPHRPIHGRRLPVASEPGRAVLAAAFRGHSSVLSPLARARSANVPLDGQARPIRPRATARRAARLRRRRDGGWGA